MVDNFIAQSFSIFLKVTFHIDFLILSINLTIQLYMKIDY